MLPNNLPPWTAVYQQMRRWIDARCLEIMVEDLRILLREFAGRKGQPTAMILDSRILQSKPESGGRGGYDGAKRRKGRRYMRPWTHWAICSPFTLPRPTSRTARRWACWPRRCNR